MIAAISGEAVISTLIWLVVLGVIFWLLNWLIDYINPQEPIKKVAKVILAIAVVVVLINVLLALAGHPLLRWGA
jgi:hypothetical protein